MRHCRANCTPGAVLQHEPLTLTGLESLITSCLKSDNANLGNLGTLLSVPCSHTHHTRIAKPEGCTDIYTESYIFEEEGCVPCIDAKLGAISRSEDVKSKTCCKS